MNKIFSKSIAAAVFVAIAMVANANPIQVAYGPVNTQPTNNGQTTITNWATDSINTFNTAQYAGWPLPSLGDYAFGVGQGAANPIGSSFGSTTYSITLDLTGYNYIVLSWGGSKIPGDTGTADYLYYIGDTTTWTFYNKRVASDGALAKGGLSGIRVYGGGTSVPEGGMTAALLGLGLVAVSLISRRRAAS